MKIVLVAAIGDNLIIGREGQLPWRLKSDLQHFRKLTLNRPLIMGRKTHESIGKVLDGRTNIVLTRDLSLVAPGTVLATSFDAALSFAPPCVSGQLRPMGWACRAEPTAQWQIGESGFCAPASEQPVFSPRPSFQLF